jgi:hypothetical protein
MPRWLGPHQLHGGRIRDVGEHRKRVRTERAHLRGDRIDGGLIAMAVHHDVRAKPREGERDRAADVLAGTGDERGAASEGLRRSIGHCCAPWFRGLSRAGSNAVEE